MPSLPKVSPIRYVVLGGLFVCALAFQATVSSTIWSEARAAGQPLLAWLAIFGNAHLFTPVACLLLGFYVASVRIWDGKAWLLFLVLLTFSVASDGSDRLDPVMRWHIPLKHLALVYRSAVVNAWFLVMLVFAIYFPERAAWDRSHPRLKWAMLIPAGAAFLVAAISRILTNEGPAAQAFARRSEPQVNVLRLVYAYGCLLISLALLLIKERTAPDPDDRRRLRVLFSGLAVSFVPALIFEAVITRMLHIHTSPWIKLLVYTPLVLFPVTLAYVTVVQRALDVRLIVRQGLQYALARRGVALLQFTISAVIVIVIAFLSGDLPLPQRMLLTIAGIAIILITVTGARRAGSWIDRRFFREAYRSEQILARLADSVGSLVELPPILTTVATRIAEALHISEIAVFLNERNCYRLAYAVGYPQAPDIEFPNESRTVRVLQRVKSPLPVYADHPRSWVATLDRDEQTILNRLGAELLLPLSRHEDLLGFLSLGRRFAEAPYSPNDIDLLRSVAQQMALAVENSQLASSIAAETAQREVLQRELAIAREVQQRLLPQACPAVPGLDCFGTCRPAREVGGDYYDFLELPDGAFGIAIGDVSGKGIPASLLMASLQASLRGQTLLRLERPEQLMANVNQLVYGASQSNRYATFFYSQYDPATERLYYVNAGHNAPMVFQPDGGDFRVTRLDVGGPPVGLLSFSSYESASIFLHPGDLVVLFTDGITEAMNVKEEEWGEGNLLAAIRRSDKSSPEAIARAIFQSADEFAGEAPQHDDMTIVVLLRND